jgi:D-3-phosphoglycerate dehydrogenase / 2-oxoglutarate reductase
MNPPNSNQKLRIVRLDLPLDGATFDAQVIAEDSVSLTVCRAHGDDAATWRALERAQLYHISSARDDLPAMWFAGAPLLARCPELLAVTTFGAGYDTVDVQACTAAGVCVVNQAGSNAGAVAEHTFGLMIGLSKRIGEIDRRLRRGERFTRQQVMGFDLHGRTLGLVGIGHTGTRVAQLGAAFGMTVLATDPLVDAAEIRRRGATPVTLPELLEAADVVSLHCPLDATTRRMFDATAFAHMKPGALFITTSRGGIHDEAALLDALNSGHLGGAGLDVWDVEPPLANHPLLGLDKVLATNHVAGVTHDSRRQMAAMGAQQVLALAAGARPPRLVNPEVWPAYAQRFERVRGRSVIAL